MRSRWSIHLCGDDQPPAIRESYLQAAAFVGHEHERALLSAALSHALQGQGSAWLVAGESGVGKTRLFEEPMIVVSDLEDLVLAI